MMLQAFGWNYPASVYLASIHIVWSRSRSFKGYGYFYPRWALVRKCIQLRSYVNSISVDIFYKSSENSGLDWLFRKDYVKRIIYIYLCCICVAAIWIT